MRAIFGTTLAAMLLAPAFVPLTAQTLPAAAPAWERLGPEGGDVISLTAGSGRTLYLGTADGHIFASEDAAAHWELRGRAGARFDGVVQRLLVDSRRPQQLFAALWFQDPSAGGGVFRSQDGGRTWTLAGLGGEAARAVEQSPSNPEILTAGTRSGVFRSNDGGANWQRISPAGDPELRNIDSLALDPHDPQVIYAGTCHLPWKTTDAGKTWTPIAAGMIDDSDIMSLRLDEQNPARLFASACSGIYRSENAGSQWIKLQGIPYAARRTQTIVQDPKDPRSLYAGTTEGLWASRDSGETWARLTPGEWVINALAITREARAHGTRIILGTEEQGVLVSDDRGLTFTPGNTGFSHRVAANLAGDPRDPRHLLARVSGLQELLFESHDAARTWQVLASSFRPADVKKLYGTPVGWWAVLNRGGLLRYDESSQEWQKLEFWSAPTPAPSSRRNKTRPPIKTRARETKESDPDVTDLCVEGPRVYVATSRGIWSSDIQEGRLRRFAPDVFPAIVQSLAVSRAGEEISAVTPDRFFQTENSGKTWKDFSPPAESGKLLWLFPAVTPKAVQPNPAALPSAWLVGTAHGVFRAPTTGGLPWQLLQSGLPAALSSPPGASSAAIAISVKAGGLYLTQDQGQNWQRLDSDAEAGIFTGIVADGQGGYFLGSRNEGVLHVTLSGTSGSPSEKAAIHSVPNRNFASPVLASF